jgi:hypothetical protein
MLHVRTFLRMIELTYHSRMLRGWYHVAPAFQTAAEGTIHMPQYVEESQCCWKLLDSCRSKGCQKWNVLYHWNQCFLCSTLPRVMPHSLPVRTQNSDSDSSIFKTPTPTPRFLKLRLLHKSSICINNGKPLKFSSPLRESSGCFLDL